MVGPNWIDVHIGGRLKQGREIRGLSRTELGIRLGVSSRQIQDYETGAARVSAPALIDITRALKTPIGFFFGGLIAREDLA